MYFFVGKLHVVRLVCVWVEIKTSLEKHKYPKHLWTRMESELEETKFQLEQLIRGTLTNYSKLENFLIMVRN